MFAPITREPGAENAEFLFKLDAPEVKYYEV
jgi:hypothetical protein